MSAPTDIDGKPLAVGQLVRLVQTRGHVKKAEAGRNMTVRAFSQRRPDEIRVDDGDPAIDDFVRSGASLGMWLPGRAVRGVR